MTKRGLGKSFNQLIKSDRKRLSLSELTAVTAVAEQASGTTRKHNSELVRIPIDKIKRGRYQPRRFFDEAALQELADSIKSQGIIQPVVLRPIDNHYELIAGERRWRAAQLAGLHELPAVIRDLSDQAALAIGLIENIQRENLNPIEEAQALRRLIDEFQLTQTQLAESIGRSRPAIANALRLLTLNPDVRHLLEHGKLETGHAKVLLALAGHQQSEAARIVIEKRLSVRETEQLVKKYQYPHRAVKAALPLDVNIRHLQQELSERLGTKVSLQQMKNGKGTLTIYYHNYEVLEGILAKIR